MTANSMTPALEEFTLEIAGHARLAGEATGLSPREISIAMMHVAAVSVARAIPQVNWDEFKPLAAAEFVKLLDEYKTILQGDAAGVTFPV